MIGASQPSNRIPNGGIGRKTRNTYWTRQNAYDAIPIHVAAQFV